MEKIHKTSWILVPVIAIGGLFIPRLGLILLPIMMILIFSGFFLGKFWCGNICPHGSLYDNYLSPLSKKNNIPAFLKSRLTKILFFALFMGMFIVRLSNIWTHWGTWDFLDKLGLIMAMNYLLPTLVGSGLAIFIRPRAWCSVCPMGTLQEIFLRLGNFSRLNQHTNPQISINNPENCTGCAVCSRVCPLELKPHTTSKKEGTKFQEKDCIKCQQCIAACPKNLLSMKR